MVWQPQMKHETWGIIWIHINSKVCSIRLLHSWTNRCDWNDLGFFFFQRLPVKRGKPRHISTPPSIPNYSMWDLGTQYYPSPCNSKIRRESRSWRLNSMTLHSGICYSNPSPDSPLCDVKPDFDANMRPKGPRGTFPQKLAVERGETRHLSITLGIPYHLRPYHLTWVIKPLSFPLTLNVQLLSEKYLHFYSKTLIKEARQNKYTNQKENNPAPENTMQLTH